LRGALLFVIAVLVGSFLGSALSHLWDSAGGLAHITPVIFVGIAMTYAAFGAIPALLFGLPSVFFLKRKGYTRWPAAAFLTVGGGLIGGLIMFVMFDVFRIGHFVLLGATAGASIGLAIGIVLFAGSSSVEA
jgi:hypothetical protein